MHSTLLLVIVVVTALAFDFTNGFHDTANVVASSISTRALSPRAAIAIASVLNFAGAFISLKVAATVASGLVATAKVTETIAFAGLVGAIAWNLITWYFGLPSSSSHALIGGVIGALLAAVGSSGVRWQALMAKVVVPALASPVIAFFVAGTSILFIYRLVGRRRPGTVTRGFKLGQVVSGGMLSLAHGTNDAQKTMGVITLALVANGSLHAGHKAPTWVIVSCALAISLGTYIGGWRVIRALGKGLVEIEAPQGMAAESSSAAVILVSSSFGYSLSTTHVATGSIL